MKKRGASASVISNSYGSFYLKKALKNSFSLNNNYNFGGIKNEK